ncbi:response regulator [Candidatus Nanohalococcus occultus]|uniref:PAS/PAC domain containing protein n=1 Tax=Candidatus Nanohalococcus occultus TaxID=2978047 RepID=A0ABY8CG60_9ARCH|nr:PAS/PAC domain containing protein [Candidatus Nanohaloarchaeota archaeon SVXNc]
MSKNILLVDDNDELRDLAEIVFEKEGLDYRTCGSGCDALELMEEREYDVLVTDYRMPEMDGEELIGEIRSRDSRTHTVLYSTDDSMAETAEVLGVPFKHKTGGLEVYRDIVEMLKGTNELALKEVPAEQYI